MPQSGWALNYSKFVKFIEDEEFCCLMVNVYDLKLSQPDIFKQFSVGKNLIVHYKCPQSERLIKLYNHYNAIYFTLNGEKSLHASEKSWHLTDHDALLVCKSAYTQEMFENLEWEVLAFHFDDNFLREVFHDYRMHFDLETKLNAPKDTILKINVNSVIKAGFYTLLPFFDSNESGLIYLLERRIKELIVSILAEPRNIEIRAYFNSVNDQHKSPIWQIMENNFMYNLSIMEFAKLTQRSITTFKNEFKEFYKTTPGKWLLNRRLAYAKELLLHSNKNISEAALESGFENTSHFSRSFKEKYNLSPSEFRESIHH